MAFGVGGSTTRAGPAGLVAVLGALLVSATACEDSATEPPPPPPAVTLPLEPPQALVDCVSGASSQGALFELCLPALWNGQVVAWAHGYVDPGPGQPPNAPLELPDDEVAGAPVRDIARAIGNAAAGFYGYATTSYRRNGLVASEGAEDLAALAEFVRESVAGLAPTLDLPVRSFLVGASEGSLSTVLALEEGGGADFGGGMALCGPIGDFVGQIDHLGDFRAVFDHFFPGVMPGTAVEIPQGTVTLANWNARTSQIGAAIAADAAAAAQVFGVTGAAVDAADAGSAENVAVDLLRYSFMGTNDARATLGGNPFGNVDRVYEGSDDDAALNDGIGRFSRAPAAASAIESGYETSGRLRVPLVAMHTLQDPIVPFWHQSAYEEKVAQAGRGALLTTIPGQQFGHCRFTMPELLGGFASLVLSVSGRNLVTAPGLVPTPAAQRAFLELAEAHGAAPVIVTR